ncbi:DnaD domain protein [Salinibacillus xinjiangensis]|uniref:DnaD domain protein n=1 Tax=Salinibacillus xinjiangensis TaxID=1229268 RepID=A0A6G1X528_9BACI|nr:DnaD domain protein [Salinibacillus xinjiangensis]
MLDELKNWISEFGDELVIEAMKKALERNKISWGYVKGILQSWANKGVTSVERAKAEVLSFQKQNPKRSRSHPYKQEVLTGWFDQEDRKKPKVDAPQHDYEHEKQELAGILDKYKKTSLVPVQLGV